MAREGKTDPTPTMRRRSTTVSASLPIESLRAGCRCWFPPCWLWAISVPSSTQSRVPLVSRAAGYGFEGVRVDGNDLLANFAVTKHLSDQIRQGSGPKLIEAVTYRLGAHTTADDPTKYRTADELEAWKQKEPLLRYKTWMEHEQVADQDYFEQIDQQAADLAAELRHKVLTMEGIDIDEVFDTVYAEPHRQVETEKAWLKDYEAGFAEEEAQ